MRNLADFNTNNQIISHTGVEATTRETNCLESPNQMAIELVKHVWLTRFQSSELLSGQGNELIFGPYHLLEPLGEGGMGLVYKAWHSRLDRLVALKFVHPELLADHPEIIHRFHREVRLIAQLQHPNFVMLYDADEIEGIPYIAMEFLEGLSSIPVGKSKWSTPDQASLRLHPADGFGVTTCLGTRPRPSRYQTVQYLGRNEQQRQCPAARKQAQAAVPGDDPGPRPGQERCRS